jgi:hypothetical protein
MIYEVMCLLGLHHKQGYLIVATHENLGQITLNDLPRGDVHMGCELQHFYFSTIISILVLILCKPLVLRSVLYQCCYYNTTLEYVIMTLIDEHCEKSY